MFIDKNQRRWNKPYSRGTTEIDGVRYPNTVWDDPAFRAAQGITEIADPVLPEGVTDETHYITRPDLPPYLEWAPKPQEQLDEVRQSKINSAALEYLASTDWLVIRAAEGGAPVPTDVLEERALCRLSVVKGAAP